LLAAAHPYESFQLCDCRARRRRGKEGGKKKKKGKGRGRKEEMLAAFGLASNLIFPAGAEYFHSGRGGRGESEEKKKKKKGGGREELDLKGLQRGLLTSHFRPLRSIRGEKRGGGGRGERRGEKEKEKGGRGGRRDWRGQVLQFFFFLHFHPGERTRRGRGRRGGGKKGGGGRKELHELPGCARSIS